MTSRSSRLTTAVLAALIAAPLAVAPAHAAPVPATPVPATPVPATPVLTASALPAAAPIPASHSTVTRYVRTTRANVRSGPSTGYSIVGSYAQGTKVTGVLTSNGWLKMATGRYISGYVLTSAAPGSSSLSSEAIITEARRYLGIMYRYGGNTPAGFDCSGYTQYVFGRLGKTLPRTVSGQRSATIPVSSPRVGDLVFWGTGHVAIYAGSGYIYDSGKPGLPVQKRRMFSGVTGYGRVG